MGTSSTVVAEMAVGSQIPRDGHRTPAAGSACLASHKSPFPVQGTSKPSHQRDGWLVVPWVVKQQPEDMGTRHVTSSASQM